MLVQWNYNIFALLYLQLIYASRVLNKLSIIGWHICMWTQDEAPGKNSTYIQSTNIMCSSVSNMCFRGGEMVKLIAAFYPNEIGLDNCRLGGAIFFIRHRINFYQTQNKL